jgi:hypothetical protein
VRCNKCVKYNAQYRLFYVRGDRPRLLAEVVQLDGSRSKLIFENKSVGDVIAPRRFDD